jgi:hypothetical protein
VSSAIGQRLDQLSPTIELRSDEEERQIDDQMDMPLDVNISKEDLVHSLPSSLRKSLNLALFSVESADNRDLMRAVGQTA